MQSNSKYGKGELELYLTLVVKMANQSGDH